MEEEKKQVKKKVKRYVFLSGKDNAKHPSFGVINQDSLTRKMILALKQYDRVNNTDFSSTIGQVEE